MKSPFIPIINVLCSTLFKCLGFHLLKPAIFSLGVRQNKLQSHSPFCSTLSINIIIQKQNFKDAEGYEIFKNLRQKKKSKAVCPYVYSSFTQKILFFLYNLLFDKALRHRLCKDKPYEVIDN